MTDADRANANIALGQVYMYQGNPTKTYTILETNILDATNYEQTGTVRKLIKYRQNYDESFPVGSVWYREESDFLSSKNGVRLLILV